MTVSSVIPMLGSWLDASLMRTMTRLLPGRYVMAPVESL